MHPNTAKWLKTANFAKKDQALIINHKGTVDMALKKILTKNTDLLNKIKNDPELHDIIKELETENSTI